MDGFLDGETVVGLFVGNVGNLVGFREGILVGFREGFFEGRRVGFLEGFLVGNVVGNLFVLEN